MTISIFVCSLLLSGCTTTSHSKHPDTQTRWKYFLTEEEYKGLDNYEAQIKLKYGQSAEIADWDEIKRSFGNDISSFLDSIDLEISSDGGALVSRGGATTYSPSRAYYLTRHGGEKPDQYWAHDQIGGYQASLGSWDTSQRVLVRVPALKLPNQHVDLTPDGAGHM